MLAVAVWPAFADDVPPATGPDTQACTDATAARDAAIPPVLDFSPDVYPDDTVPAVADVDAALLQAILDDPDLGGGARAQVEALVALFEAREVACTAPTVPDPTDTTTPSSTTPEPTTTTAAPTTTTSPPSNADLTGLDCDEFATRADAQEALDAGQGDPHRLDGDADGIACESGGQVQVHPEGGVDTGGWPAE
ncbi:MAG: excalibur calcium-binding domain-containing protein [Dehalococcoidia bacterium]